MSTIPYIVIFLISLFTVKRFHTARAIRHNKISALYIGDSLIHLPEGNKRVKELFRLDKAGRQHELLQILNELVTDATVFPDQRIYHAVYNWLEDTNNLTKVGSNRKEQIAFHSHRGWGGIVIRSGFGKYVYIVGYYKSLKASLKNHTEIETIQHLEHKATLRNSTNIVICSAELDDSENKTAHHGFKKKIDFIGCLFVDN